MHYFCKNTFMGKHFRIGDLVLGKHGLAKITAKSEHWKGWLYTLSGHSRVWAESSGGLDLLRRGKQRTDLGETLLKDLDSSGGLGTEMGTEE